MEEVLAARALHAPHLQRFRHPKHLLRGAVDGALDVLQARVHADAGHGELHVHVEERPLDEEESATASRAEPLLHRREGPLRGGENRLVHQPRVVRVEGRNRLRLDVRLLVIPRRVLDEFAEVRDAAPHLRVSDDEVVRLPLDEFGLRGLELLVRKRLIVGKVHHRHLGHHLEVRLDAVLEHVLHLGNEQLKLRQPPVDAHEVPVDVHGRPRQRVHPGLESSIQVLQVRREEPLGDGRNRAHHPVVLLQRVTQLVVVVLELFLLQQHHLRRLGHLDAHALQVLRLAHQLHDLLVEIHQQRPRLRVSDDEGRLQTCLG